MQMISLVTEDDTKTGTSGRDNGSCKIKLKPALNISGASLRFCASTVGGVG